LLVTPTIPKPAPLIVKLVDPVLGAFPSPTTSSKAGASYDNIFVDVPEQCSDADMESLRVRFVP
jgi:hypothetical protein